MTSTIGDRPASALLFGVAVARDAQPQLVGHGLVSIALAVLAGVLGAAQVLRRTVPVPPGVPRP